MTSDWQDVTGTEQVKVDRVRDTLVVRSPTDGDVIVDITVHRADVVRRLLDLGVSVPTLRTLLPEWCRLISSVAGRNSN